MHMEEHSWGQGAELAAKLCQATEQKKEKQHAEQYTQQQHAEQKHAEQKHAQQHNLPQLCRRPAGLPPRVVPNTK